MEQKHSQKNISPMFFQISRRMRLTGVLAQKSFCYRNSGFFEKKKKKSIFDTVLHLLLDIFKFEVGHFNVFSVY